MRTLLLVGLLGLSTIATAGETIHNDKYDFSFVVPDGMSDFPDGHDKPEMLYAFARGTPGEPHFEIVAVHDLGGTIGREPLDHAAVERGARKAAGGVHNDLRFDYGKIRWRDFDLDLVIGHDKRGDAEVVTFTAQLPFERGAVQLITSGFVADEAELRKLHERTLATFTGRSNWRSDFERGEALGRVIGFLVGVPLAIWLMVWIKRRRQRANNS
jgi:hypothetical protein